MKHYLKTRSISTHTLRMICLSIVFFHAVNIIKDNGKTMLTLIMSKPFVFYVEAVKAQEVTLSLS